MSKRHTYYLKKHTNNVASCNTIYNEAEQVLCELLSAAIAEGFLLAHHICGKVIDEGGDKFLSRANFHMGVRSDYIDTPTGISLL